MDLKLTQSTNNLPVPLRRGKPRFDCKREMFEQNQRQKLKSPHDGIKIQVCLQPILKLDQPRWFWRPKAVSETVANQLYWTFMLRVRLPVVF